MPLETPVPDASSISRGEPFFIGMLHLQVSGRHVAMGAEILFRNFDLVGNVVFVDDLKAEGVENGAGKIRRTNAALSLWNQADLFGEVKIKIEERSPTARSYDIFDIAVLHRRLKGMFPV